MNSESLVNVLRKIKGRLFRASHNSGEFLPPDMEVDVQAKSIMAAVRPYTMTSVERLYGLIQAVRYLNHAKVEGAFVECGVWRGGSSMAMALVLQQLNDSTRDLFLYDTFEGMTAPTAEDIDPSGLNGAELLKSQKVENDPNSVWCYSSFEDVKKNINITNYPAEKIHLVKGPVEVTLPASAPNQIALLRLDTDWYESTRHELETLFPKLSQNGILIIDDYGHWKGARKAVDEYFADNKIPILLNRLDYTGRIAIKTFKGTLS